MNTKDIAATAIISVTAKGEKYKGHSKSQHNTAATWELVKAQLKAKPKTTRAELFTYLQEERNHACFVTYALNRGWLQAK